MASEDVGALRGRDDDEGKELIESADVEAEVREKPRVPTPSSMTTSDGDSKATQCTISLCYPRKK